MSRKPKAPPVWAMEVIALIAAAMNSSDEPNPQEETDDDD